jgi:hypothetical protein
MFFTTNPRTALTSCRLKPCLSITAYHSLSVASPDFLLSTSDSRLAVASTVILGSQIHETYNHILPSDGSRSLQTTLLWLSTQSQSQSYFTTGSIQPISSSCRQAPSGSRPEIFEGGSQVIPWDYSPYVISSVTRRYACLLLILWWIWSLSRQRLGKHCLKTE